MGAAKSFVKTSLAFSLYTCFSLSVASFLNSFFSLCLSFTVFRGFTFTMSFLLQFVSFFHFPSYVLHLHVPSFLRCLVPSFSDFARGLRPTCEGRGGVVGTVTHLLGLKLVRRAPESLDLDTSPYPFQRNCCLPSRDSALGIEAPRP